LALILVIAAGFATAATHWNEINVETLEIRIREFGIWAPLLFIAAYCVAAIFFLPATLFTLAAGVLFGPLWGAVYSLAGASLGAALAFFVARYIAANWISGHAGPRVSRIIDGVAEEGWRFVAVTRLIPICAAKLFLWRLARAISAFSAGDDFLHGTFRARLFLAWSYRYGGCGGAWQLGQIRPPGARRSGPDYLPAARNQIYP
jgi:hypothetical protein